MPRVIDENDVRQRVRREMIIHYLNQHKFSNKSKRKPGPTGPSKVLIQAIIEMKQRNPRFGCRRIAMQINITFGFNIINSVRNKCASDAAIQYLNKIK